MLSESAFDVSVLVTVYNKERYIADTVRSLTTQEGALKLEYIFADDVSTDRTLDMLAECTRGLANVTVIRNSDNAGPSVRLNQAARLARGKYLLCFDSDDILAANAMSRMFTLMEQHEADVVYGQWEKTGLPGAALIGRRVPDEAACELSETPLDFVLRGRFLRMALMVRRDVFLAAGGADERIFIQDESLPLRLAARCRRFLALAAPVMFVPAVAQALSGNVSQLNHDRFLAHYYLLRDGVPMSDEARGLLYRRCISAAWKQRRHERGALLGAFGRVFFAYLGSRIGAPALNEAVLHRLYDDFSALSGVRRAGAKR